MRSNTIFRELRIEAMLEAGYTKNMSPSVRRVVLDVADELYEEKINELFGERMRTTTRTALRYRPSFDA
ncbi:MAG: hypothetical protein RLY14_1737 [Planctomycetota bacterium]|jgi:hypothetical protein